MSQYSLSEQDLLNKQPSLTDTIPNTPEPFSIPGGSFQPFARLAPINAKARSAFDYAVDAIKHNPDLFEYARRNMCIESARQESVSVASVFTDSEDYATGEEHQQQLEKFMKECHGVGWEGLQRLLGPSPDAMPIRLHKYSWTLGAFAKGTFGQVAAGTGSEGNAVAVKRIYNPVEAELSAHRKMMAYLGRHVSVVSINIKIMADLERAEYSRAPGLLRRTGCGNPRSLLHISASGVRKSYGDC